jgi:hypothetical protein
METLDFTPRCASRYERLLVAGIFLRLKVEEQVAVSGAYQAAKNLRKQGASLDVALALVAGRV